MSQTTPKQSSRAEYGGTQRNRNRNPTPTLTRGPDYRQNLTVSSVTLVPP